MGEDNILKILRLGHYALKVADIERSARFYRDILGLHEGERGPLGEAHFQRRPDHHCLRQGRVPRVGTRTAPARGNPLRVRPRP
ncbi:MAG: VOC family protein [Nitrospinota bacterium]|nr:VOC family protein [Nitrospinota bacterium]HJM41724.1 VOC family protein [Nitrospinota bacterium]